MHYRRKKTASDIASNLTAMQFMLLSDCESQLLATPENPCVIACKQLAAWLMDPAMCMYGKWDSRLAIEKYRKQL
jgi:hypothetical protein